MGDERPWLLLASALRSAAAAEGETSASQAVAESCLPLLAADSVSVSRFEPERGLLRTLVNAGRLGAGEQVRPTDETYAIADFTMLDQLVTDVRAWRLCLGDRGDQDDPRELELLRERERYAAVAVPVVLEGRVWGEIYASRVGPPGFTDHDRDVLCLVGVHLGTVLTLLQLSDRRAAYARVDPLTGLARRDDAERLVANCHDGVVLAALDLDGLKKVNDDFGHAAGDRLLVEAARALTAATEGLPGRLVCRIGGDEFALVVPGLDVCAVHEACLRARDLLVAAVPDAGLSCGIARSTDLTGGLASGRPLFRLADATLYRAKRSGAQGPLRAWEGRGANYAPAPQGVGSDVEAPLWPRCLAKLQTPVDVFARSVNAAAWWISHSPAGSGQLITRDRLILRDGRNEDGADMTLVGAVFDLEHLPMTGTALQGRSLHIGINDPDCHPSEQSFLAELGYTSVLMAGATDVHGDGWLVEISCDPATARLDRMGATLLQLVTRAVRSTAG